MPVRLFWLYVFVYSALGLFVCGAADEDILVNPIFMNDAFEKIPELIDSDVSELKRAILNNQECFLFFYADWCPACQDFKPSFNLLNENKFFESNKIKAYKVSAEKNLELTARFFIASLPSLIHIRSGKIRDISSMRWKLVEYFDDGKWAETKPWGFLWEPFGLFATVLGMSTRYGHFIAKEAESLNWPKWKWFVAFFSCFALAWGPALYLGLADKLKSSGDCKRRFSPPNSSNDKDATKEE